MVPMANKCLRSTKAAISTYSLVNVDITDGKITIFHGTTQYFDLAIYNRYVRLPEVLVIYIYIHMLDDFKCFIRPIFFGSVKTLMSTCLGTEVPREEAELADKAPLGHYLPYFLGKL